MKRAVLGAVLALLGTGCDRIVHGGRPAVYAAWQEGMTLSFVDPSQPAIPSLQVRVSRYRNDAAGALVTHTYGNLSGQMEATFRLKGGGIFTASDGQAASAILPEGFPDRVSQWMGADHRFNRVIGRSRVDLPGVRLADPDAVGVWVETFDAGGSGPVRRTLLVPDYGEVLALNLREGRWVEVNRLKAWQYTDLPVTEQR